MKSQLNDDDLLDLYIASFERLDNLCTFDVAEELRFSTDVYGCHHWRPMRYKTHPSALQALYQGLGLSGEGSTRFPPLYETLILSYRWAEVDLGVYRLLANPPADDLSPLLANIRADKNIVATLLPNGYVQFGKGADMDYDPVCFDFRHRQRNGDCRIVRIDHEAILSDYRIYEKNELAPNFRSLILNTITASGVLSEDIE